MAAVTLSWGLTNATVWVSLCVPYFTQSNCSLGFCKPFSFLFFFFFFYSPHLAFFSCFLFSLSLMSVTLPITVVIPAYMCATVACCEHLVTPIIVLVSVFLAALAALRNVAVKISIDTVWFAVCTPCWATHTASGWNRIQMNTKQSHSESPWMYTC